jgi:ribonuclease J
MATQSYKGLMVEEGDTVVLSARIIPGNERLISRMIGLLYKRGANIIEEKRRLVHVSGHASQEDIRIMTEAVRPKFVVPVHGEYRMLFRHKEFVKNHLGYAEENIILIENGDVLELDGERAMVVDKREIGRTFIDESGFEEIDSETVDEESGELQDEPRIVARGVRGLGANGFPDRAAGNNQPESKSMMADAKRVITASITGASRQTLADETLLKEHVRVELKRFIQKQTGARPVILPIIVVV